MSTVMMALKKFIERFWPEAKAKIVEEEENEVIVDFYGHMCYTCGIYDYFDDFRYILEDESGSSWKIEKYEEFEGESGRVFRVVFRRSN
ncbi:MAG: hypothetical protein ACP5KE_04940 [Candidatus Methanodesulfokora sp.]|nr:MAG: hypothetical protein C0200_01280 [Candidatus Korarchaeota archaeon]